MEAFLVSFSCYCFWITHKEIFSNRSGPLFVVAASFPPSDVHWYCFFKLHKNNNIKWKHTYSKTIFHSRRINAKVFTNYTKNKCMFSLLVLSKWVNVMWFYFSIMIKNAFKWVCGILCTVRTGYITESHKSHQIVYEGWRGFSMECHWILVLRVKKWFRSAQY